MGEIMKAPRIKQWIRVLRGGKMVFDKQTNETVCGWKNTLMKGIMRKKRG